MTPTPPLEVEALQEVRRDLVARVEALYQRTAAGDFAPFPLGAFEAAEGPLREAAAWLTVLRPMLHEAMQRGSVSYAVNTAGDDPVFAWEHHTTTALLALERVLIGLHLTGRLRASKDETGGVAR